METRQVSLNETLIFIHFYALIPLTPSMPRTLNFPNKRSLCGVFECYFTLTVPTPYLINVKHPEKRTLLSLSCVPAGALDSAPAEPRKGGEKGEGGGQGRRGIGGRGGEHWGWQQPEPSGAGTRRVNAPPGTNRTGRYPPTPKHTHTEKDFLFSLRTFPKRGSL